MYVDRVQYIITDVQIATSSEFFPRFFGELG